MKTLLAAGIGLTAILGACQSQDEDTPQPPTATFTYTGTAQNFTPITFTSNAPGAATYAWDFGDATVSTQPNPAHAFRKAGTYAVVLRATGANGTATTSQNLTLAQADTAALIGQQLAGNYFFNRVYRINYNTSTNSPAIYTRLRDTTMTVTPLSFGGISLYSRDWALRGSGNLRFSGVLRPVYSYAQGVGSLSTQALFLQSGDSVSFTISKSAGLGSGPKEALSFRGGKVR